MGSEIGLNEFWGGLQNQRKNRTRTQPTAHAASPHFKVSDFLPDEAPVFPHGRSLRPNAIPETVQIRSGALLGTASKLAIRKQVRRPSIGVAAHLQRPSGASPEGSPLFLDCQRAQIEGVLSAGKWGKS